MTTEATDKRRCHHRLSQLLGEDLAQVEELRSCLDAIAKALTEQDAGALKALLEQQVAFMEDAEARGEERKALVSALGFETDGDGLERAIAWCDTDGELSELWSRLKSGVGECTERNQHNLALVRKSQDRVQRAIGVLVGNGRGAYSAYDPSGRSVQDNEPRSVAKA